MSNHKLMRARKKILGQKELQIIREFATKNANSASTVEYNRFKCQALHTVIASSFVSILKTICVRDA